MTAKGQLVQFDPSGVAPWIERQYQRMAPYQWAREVAKNAEEAGATEVWFATAGVRGEAVRYVVDNGGGMDPETLKSYMQTIGRTSKRVDGLHGNYGIGSRIALLPWTDLAIVSRQAGETWMVVLEKTAGGDYALRNVELEEGWDTLWQPGGVDEDYRLEFAEIIPEEWEHGTAVVLLGRDGWENTYRGDPAKGESDTSLARYLNRRFYEPALHIRVWQLDDANATWLRAAGAHHVITTGEEAVREDVVTLDDEETVVHVMVRDEPRGAGRTDPGYVAMLYQGELYGIDGAASRFDRFGIVGPLKRRTYLVVEPPSERLIPAEERSGLRWRSEAGHVTDIPWAELGEQFYRAMPEWLREEAAKDLMQRADADDEALDRELLRHFAALRAVGRADAPQLSIVEGGAADASPELPLPHPPTDTESTPRVEAVKRATRRASARRGQPGEGEKGRNDARKGASLPEVKFVERDDPYAEGIDAPSMARWVAHAPGAPAGVVFVLRDHPQMQAIYRLRRSEFPEVPSEIVDPILERHYAHRLKSVILHTETLIGPDVARSLVEESYRSQAALTTALLGVAAPQDELLAAEIARATGRRALEVV